MRETPDAGPAEHPTALHGPAALRHHRAALGNPYIQTPALDSLVAEGTSFTSTYTASPVCIAARCSLVLGQYAHQTGCTANIPMPRELTSLMERLSAAGYQAHGVGKMHFWPDSHGLWGFESRDYSEEAHARGDASASTCAPMDSVT